MLHQRITEEIYERCDEILKKDKRSKEFDDCIIAKEATFLQTLNEDQRHRYLEIEKLTIAQKEHDSILLYVAAMEEIKNDRSKRS